MAKHMAPQHSQPAERSRRSPVPLVVGALVLVVIGAGIAIAVHRAPQQGAVPAQEQADAVPAKAGQTERAEGAAIDPEEGIASAEGDGASYATELAHMFAQGEVTSVRLVGDSITAGYGTTSYVEPDAAGETAVIYDDGETVHHEVSTSAQSWANAFREYAGAHGVKSFVNAGINGAFMKGLAEQPDAWLADGADVVFVALGTNDAGYYGPSEFRADAEAALEAAERVSKVVVVLSPVRDLRPTSQLVEPAGDLGDILSELCDERGYLFVDPRDAVTPEMFNDDGLHPNSEGSMAIWQCVQETLGL